MDISEFLITNMVDLYGEYLEVNENVSYDEFDSLFIDEDGEEISDIDFILSNYEDMFEDVIFEELYVYITDVGISKDIDLKRIVAFLASKYYIYNYNGGNNSVIKYLRNTPIEEIENLFVENMDFGTDMVKAFFYALVDQKRYVDNQNLVYAKQDEKKVLEFENTANIIEIATINKILRDNICELYDYYIQNGCDDITALNYTWAYFTKDFDPIGKLDQMGFDYQTKRSLNKYTISLMFADLYEDICNKAIIGDNIYEDRALKAMILIEVQLGALIIPSDEEMRNRLLKYFILLQNEEDKKKENRKKTFEDKREKILKKVNPSYFLDELT